MVRTKKLPRSKKINICQNLLHLRPVCKKDCFHTEDHWKGRICKLYLTFTTAKSCGFGFFLFKKTNFKKVLLAQLF